MSDNDGDDEAFDYIDVECRRCGSDMVPTSLPSGAPVMRCPSCGLVAI